jgi:membrane protein
MPDYLLNIWPWLRYVSHRFAEDQCMRAAAALTYMSLFALVPLMTVMFVMVSSIPAFSGVGEQMQSWLFDNLIPSAGREMQTYLHSFSQQARNLTGIGIGFLLVTAVLMLRNIESAFNQIWRTRKNRSPISSFLLYWAVLSLGPICLGLALGISTYLTSVTIFIEDIDSIGVRSTLLGFAPFLLTVIAFTLIFAAVPNCPVRLLHALVGGVTTALLFNLARTLFTKAVVGSSYTVIYGAFAAFPLFLLWLFLSWNIVLVGGIIVHSLSAFQSAHRSGQPMLIRALALLELFWLRQRQGDSLNENELFGRNAARQGLDSETWRFLRDRFLEQKLLQIDERGGYLLARDLNDVTLWQLKEWVNDEVPPDSIYVDQDEGWRQRAASLLRAERIQSRQDLDISLAGLFRQ